MDNGLGSFAGVVGDLPGGDDARLARVKHLVSTLVVVAVEVAMLMAGHMPTEKSEEFGVDFFTDRIFH